MSEQNERDKACETTIDESMTVLRKMDVNSTDPFTFDERKAVMRLGMEILMRGPERARVEKFLDENDLRGLLS
jgi:hypothetical protein